jgi:hypothetical protein
MEEDKKRMYLWKIDNLEMEGFRPTRRLTLEDDLEEISFEATLLQNRKDKAWKKLMYLDRIYKLEKEGFIPRNRMNVEDSLEDILSEVDFLQNQKARVSRESM